MTSTPTRIDYAAARVRLEAVTSDREVLEGKKGAALVAVSAADGTTLAEYDLDAPPVFDGMAAAGGKLYLALINGTVICMRGK